MLNLSDLAFQSRLPLPILQRAVSAGLCLVVFGFAVHAGLRFPRAFVTAADIHRWCEVDGITDSEVNLLIRDLVLDEMEAFFGDALGVVGINSPNRDQGTGFEESDQRKKK